MKLAFAPEQISFPDLEERLTRPITIPAAIEAAAMIFRDAPAVIENGETWSFTELWARARAAAAAFLAAGLKAGETVGIWAPNCREWILATLGAQICGARIVPLNTRYKGREASDILRRAHAVMLCMTSKFLGTDYEALLQDEALPGLRRRIIFGGARPGGWDHFIAGGANIPPQAVDAALNAVSPDGICDILFTSGTTGAPKGVLTTHYQVISLFHGWAKLMTLRAGDRFLIVNPFFHTFGYKAGWVSALLRGATVVPMPVYEPAQAARLILEQKISFLPGPPTIYQTLLAEKAQNGLDLSSLRVAVTGAAVVPPVLIERMHGELGIETIFSGYGMTECGVIAMTREGDPVETVAGSCGSAVPGIEIKCVDDKGNTLPAGVAGEILVRGYGVMRGYLDDPAATEEAIDKDGWLHTGDIGTLDERHYLRITDRKKDMFITGGFNCYPAEIEKILCEHPKVEMAAVISIPDERLGEVGKAFLVLRPGQQAGAAEIIAWARENMANFKVPRSVEFRTELPRNAAGKVMRVELRNHK
ncbi:3-[(3aS,4S,7aS)-7a-methyl-1,5-dioxo-octahydro-1H- inden-4-yl]propanoyl:CoA ligase [Acidocella aquatica]|uniref:3-[(3aS,4S,7aS)-7a-methyl-1, 5-dioxo-octahydro-1H- inden-4-yl]propanoyl:CoA ligase n=1 Tax=Acidocella aquatica TaxID=1922313 RepID=A0ABQ6A1N6_9PROT|nr:FadD3 family acyl-CoA ligase [Acidocella aquatica]GLR66064.1 3-[(3aS,4S,7aS)-7a-methyl-1,5-dioxo-octahydro-1H- inden-4-yl]propanoyl:CoA ligase [Acidocella aquatica]